MENLEQNHKGENKWEEEIIELEKEIEEQMKEINEETDEEIKTNKIFSRHDKVVEFSNEIKKKYPDYEKYLAYHILIGSTPDYENIDEFDFPKEDSVLKFVKEKLKFD